ncbi:CD79B protein, partial [Rhinopomastus cyanomelas]|nr:CD79B protein [Rhinopomastus cyanomelas]
VGLLTWALTTVSGLFSYLAGGISAQNNSIRNSTGSRCPMVQQHPRYVEAKKNMPMHFLCYSPEPNSMQWYKTSKHREDFDEMDHNTSRYHIERTDYFINLTIFRVSYQDNGIYVCDSKNLTAEKKQPHLCGTELKVTGHTNIQKFQNRNTLKDTIIVIQSILIVIFISVPVFLLLDKGESKESPEDDHTYEGLEVEQMAAYEDITPFRAKWTVGEHPGEE